MVAEDEEQSDVFSELSESELMAIATGSVSHSRDAYSRACRRVKTVELSHVLSNLSSSNISLANALIGDKGAIALAEALCNNPVVMSLNLRACSIVDGGTRAIADMLRENMTLICIDLSFNQIDNPAGLALVEAIATNSVLEELSVANNRLGDPFVQAAASHLFEHPSLRTLDIGGNRFSAKSGELLATLVRGNEENVKFCSPLTGLYVGMNNLGGTYKMIKGVEMLCGAAFSPHSTLLSLDLCFNGIDDETGVVLGQQFAESRSLQLLDVSHNRLKANAAFAFAAALKENVTLQVLKMGWNPLGIDATCAIIRSMGKRSALRSLRIENTSDINRGGGEQDALFAADEVASKFLKRGQSVPHVVVEYPDRSRSVVVSADRPSPSAPPTAPAVAEALSGCTGESAPPFRAEQKGTPNDAKPAKTKEMIEEQQKKEEKENATSAASLPTFHEGDKVLVRKDRGKRYFPGIVTCVHDDGKYNISYNGGDRELHVLGEYVVQEPYSKMTEFRGDRLRVDWTGQAPLVVDDWSSDEEEEAIANVTRRVSIAARDELTNSINSPTRSSKREASWTIREKHLQQERCAVEKKLRNLALREAQRERTGALSVLHHIESMLDAKGIRVGELMAELDENGDEALDLNEFEKLLTDTPVSLPLKRDDVLTVFEYLDTDHDRRVDRAELEEALRAAKQDRQSARHLMEDLSHLSPVPKGPGSPR